MINENEVRPFIRLKRYEFCDSCQSHYHWVEMIVAGDVDPTKPKSDHVYCSNCGAKHLVKLREDVL